MKKINEKNKSISTILAFILIPLSGLVTDMYLPSLPDMASVFHTDAGAIQNTLILFLISYGVAQVFAGSVLDSFGRYTLNLVSLFIFSISNFVIVFTHTIELVYLMRIIQGIATAFIVVGKRAFFVDVYTGEKQKHYTGMLTIVWATAPITAPFIGGFLQNNFGWTSNFYLLGCYGFVMLIMEWLFSGESLQQPQPFRLNSVLSVYKKLITSFDFSSGILILGISYSMVMVFSMSLPFIVEHEFHLSPVVTGYCALLSGLSLFFGGILGKSFKKEYSFLKKAVFANIIQGIIILLMMVSAIFTTRLFPLMFFVMIIHIIGGFIYNLFFTYCLTRFPQNAGTASGITSGGSYLVTSVISTAIISFIMITGQASLAIGYLILSLMLIGVLLSLRFIANGRLRHINKRVGNPLLYKACK